MDDSKVDIKTSYDLADERTDLAHERTFLANERTFIAWLRTGLALVGAGLGIVKFLGQAGPIWLIRALGIMLVLAGESSYVFAYWRYSKICQKLEYQRFGITPFWLLSVLTITLFTMTVVSILVIFNS